MATMVETPTSCNYVSTKTSEAFLKDMKTFMEAYKRHFPDATELQILEHEVASWLLSHGQARC